ncbi:MAG: hypothetical protein LBS40_05615 [Burkholderiales bacterium]|jgi:hypothetical protein|nr:hypothetical protein [Burkholderiales bacterium]
MLSNLLAVLKNIFPCKSERGAKMLPLLHKKLKKYSGVILAAVVGVFFIPSVYSQTTIPNNITSDLHLNFEQSPYLITNDVVINNAASLVIDPGVTIFMGMNANLIVKSGSIQARGSVSARIQVTSDRVRIGQMATPGDWGQWIFQEKTTDTILEYVKFEYGNGLAVYGSAPVFSHLLLENHKEAAITIDLAASPTGGGNVAENNGWNGIIVPSGDIQKDVIWGLKGIPYLILSGTLHVGVAPTLINLDPAVAYVGQGPFELKLQGRHFTDQSIVMVDGIEQTTQFISKEELRISLPEPSKSLLITVKTPDDDEPGQYLYTDEIVLGFSEPFLEIVPNNTWVTLGKTKTLTLKLPYPAPPNGSTVTLASSVSSIGRVPDILTVPEGKKSLDFEFISTALGQTVITASKSDFISGESYVSVVPTPALTLEPSLIRVSAGRTLPVTIRSTVPAEEDGLTVQLNNSNSTVATHPTAVTIASGQTQATFNVATLALGESEILAKADGFSDGVLVVKVLPRSVLLPEGTTVAPSLSRPVPVTLTEPAPEGGTKVTLFSENQSVVMTPSSVVIPPGKTAINFTLNGISVGQTTIKAIAEGYQEATMMVTVEPIIIGIGNPNVSKITIAKEGTETYPVTISRPAPMGGVSIDLFVEGQSVASVSPSHIEIPEGQTSAFITVKGVSEGEAMLKASSPGLTAAEVQIVVTKKAVLDFLRTSTAVGKGMKTSGSELTIQRLVDGKTAPTAEPLTIQLTSSAPGKVNVPGTITMPANAYSVTFQVEGVEVTDVPVTIDAVAVGHASPEEKLKVNTVIAKFTITGLETNRSVGGARDEIGLSAVVDGAYYNTYQVMARDTTFDLSIEEADPADIVDGFYDYYGEKRTQVTWSVGRYYLPVNTPQYVYIGSPKSAGTYKVKLSSEVGSVTSPVVTVSGNLGLKFTRTETAVGKGMKTYGSEVSVQRTADGKAYNGTESLVVTLVSSSEAIFKVPVTVTIPSGSSSVYFPIEGVDLGSAIVIASANGHTYVDDLNVRVVIPQLVFTGLSNIRVGEKSNFGFYMNVPGAYYSTNQMPTSGFTIHLSSSAPGVATVPAATAYPANSNYSNYVDLTGVSPGQVVITASGTDLGTAVSNVITISP